MGFSSIENYKLTYFIYFTLVDSKQLNLRKSINFVSIELIILIILLILFYPGLQIYCFGEGPHIF